MPSPETPQVVPHDDLTRSYSRLLAACYELRKHETNALDLADIEKCIEFGERRLTALVESYEPTGAPGSVPAPPASPQMAAPQAAPAAQGPGIAQPAPPPGAAVMAGAA